MPDRWADISALFEAALKQPPEKRSTWVENACGDDEALRNEVERMLAAHDRADGILDRSPEIPSRPFDHKTTDSEESVYRVGPYRLLQEVGRGGMGVVYKARDPRLERFVALKFLPASLATDPEATARFETEAQAVAALDHANICTIYDVGTVETATEDLPAGLLQGQLFLAMAYYNGPTLDEHVDRAPLSVDKSVSLALDVAIGLRRAHDAGIIHRDVKPSNLIQTEQGNVKILDFGIAKLEREAPWTEPTDPLGTVAYMAPEQVRGDDVGPQTDLWALGVVLYELLTGQHPFGGGPDGTLLSAILHDNPPTVRSVRPECPDVLDEVVRTTLAKKPEQRYSSATDLIADLEDVQHLHGAPGNTMASPASLPAPLTSFIGRESEVTAVIEQLSSSRLCTLTGPAGTGKTRLAVQVASRMWEHMNDGVFFVPLAPVRDPDLVASAIAQALNVNERPVQPIAERLTTVLQDREALLVLDNFEQVSSAASLVAELLSACSGLRVLVTSRKALRVSGEHEFPLPPLDVPPSEVDPQSEALTDYSAVALFVERAAAVRPDFTLTEANTQPVAELCRRLEGLPLAIELAAARIKLFSPREMLTRLGEHLDLLRGGPHDRPARHQTLRQAIGWSYDLLDEREQAFFRRMAVFVDGCTLEAAEAITNAYESVQLDVADAVERLLDRNLLHREDGPGNRSRYVMLEMIRAYGLEQLQVEGEADATQKAHAHYFLSLAETAKPKLTGSNQGQWLDRLETEHDNFRAALSWTEEQDRTKMGLRLGTALWRFWAVRGHLREGSRRMERMLDHPAALARTPVRARALNASGTLLHELSDFDAARIRLEESLQIWREIGDQQGIATALNNLGWIGVQTSNFDRAQSLSEEALSLCRALGSKRGIALSLNNLGWVALFRGAFERARSLYQESLTLRSDLEDKRGTAFALTNQAWVEHFRAEYECAETLLDEADAILKALNDEQLIAWTYNIRALVAHAQGALENASTTASESVSLWRTVGNREGLIFALCTLSDIRLDTGDSAGARRCLDEALPMIRDIDNRWHLAFALRIRGAIAQKMDDKIRALEQHQKSLEIWADLDAKWGIVTCLEAIARSCHTDEPERAIRLLATAEAQRDRIQAPRPPVDQDAHERLVARLRRHLGQEAFQAAWDAEVPSTFREAVARVQNDNASDSTHR